MLAIEYAKGKKRVQHLLIHSEEITWGWHNHNIIEKYVRISVNICCESDCETACCWYNEKYLTLDNDFTMNHKFSNQ